MEHRTNTPEETAEQYYKRNMAIPLIDHFLTESQSRFSEQAKRATNILKLIPSAIEVSRPLKGTDIKKDIELYKEDLSSPATEAELVLHMWHLKWKEMPSQDRPSRHNII